MCGRRRKLCRGSVDEGGDEERMGGGLTVHVRLWAEGG